jgi:preprotein translocase subunit SecG
MHTLQSDRTVSMPEAERRQVAELPGFRGFSGLGMRSAAAPRPAGGMARARRTGHRLLFDGGASAPAHRQSAPRLAATRYPWRVETILSVLQVAFAVVLIFLVLMHSGKDAGLSGAFGVGSGSGPLGGGSLVERNLNRWTILFAVLFFVNAFILLKSS